MKGDPDWSMYEIDDIVWDGFGQNDDYLVPLETGHQVKEIAEVVDAHEKQEQEIGSAGESTSSGRIGPIVHPRSIDESFQSSADRSSWSHVSSILVPASFDAHFEASTSVLSSHNLRCGNNSKKDTECNIICSNNKNAVNDNKGCQFPSDHISTVITDLDFGGEDRDTEIDLMVDDWPDISNIEDIDPIFRNANSACGKGSTNSVDELPWLSSSSHAIYGSKYVFELDCQSSCSEFSVLNSTSGCPYGSASSLHANDLLAVCGNKLSGVEAFASEKWLDCNTKTNRDYAPNKKLYDGEDGVKMLCITNIGNEKILLRCEDGDTINRHTKLLENLCESSEKISKQHSECKSSSSVCQLGQKQLFSGQKFSSPAVLASETYPSEQKHFYGSSSSGCIPVPSPPKQMEYTLPIHQVPFSLTTSCNKFEYESIPSTSYNGLDHAIDNASLEGKSLYCSLSNPSILEQKERVENMHLGQQLPNTLIPEAQKQNALSSVQKTRHDGKKFLDEIRGENRLKDQRGNLPTCEMDVLMKNRSPCMASVVLDDLSPEAASFQLLQEVMDQLDVKTKVCIRDSLYRLARNAEQRHGFTHANGYIAGTRDAGRQGREGSKNSSGYTDVETDTNPIDRSVAHLLFHSPSEPAYMPADDSTSIWSRSPTD